MFKQIVLFTKTGVSGKTADIKHYFGSVIQENCLSLTFIPNMYSVLTVTCTFTIMYSVHHINSFLNYLNKVYVLPDCEDILGPRNYLQDNVPQFLGGI